MSHLLRSEGYATHASAGLAAGGILNIILDPIFMFVILEPGREVAGAAMATLLSNCVVLVYFIVIYFVIRKKSVISLDPKKFLPKKHHIGSIFAIGFPAALGSLLACLSNMMINKLVAGYGDIPVAAIGIVKKIDMLPMNVGMGLCQGMVPLVAYNYASGNYKRMKEFASAARFVGITFALVCILIFQTFAGGLVSIFIGDAATIEYGTKFLRICCLAVPLMIFNFQLSFTFQAMGMGKQSLLLSSMRQGLVNIPLLLIMNATFGLYGVVWTQFIADSITATISYIVYKRSYTKLLSKAENLPEM
jgi:Na+-driven multidrug efflux pump